MMLNGADVCRRRLGRLTGHIETTDSSRKDFMQLTWINSRRESRFRGLKAMSGLVAEKQTLDGKDMRSEFA